VTALLIYPVHKNCSEVEDKFLEEGIRAAAYPGRLTETSNEKTQNCWNQRADLAESMGLPVVKTICPLCDYRKKCLAAGYLRELIAVENADVAICTHKRAEFSGLPGLMGRRSYIAIHEHPVDILRPAVQISERDLGLIQGIGHRVLNDPSFLNWFGDDLRVDDNGVQYHSEEQRIRRDRQFRFCHILLDGIDDLVTRLQQAETTGEWRPSATMKRPEGIERTLFRATRNFGVQFEGQAWRFALSAAGGELHSAAIIVSKQWRKGEPDPVVLKSVCGFRNNLPGNRATVWFNDATLTRERLEMILGRSVTDLTPGARLDRQKKAVQILRDITRKTTPQIFRSILRGVLADRPQAHRVGVICHRPHVTAAKSLGEDFGRRIVKISYFGSGEERSSNDWHQECDLIVVAGTPRIPPAAIATYLVQAGEVGAACRESPWGTLYWDGQTESGEPIRVKSRGYEDESWRRAHRDLVRAQMVQAIGRGRGVLETGCEVVVLSSEECGIPISDAGLEALSGASTQVLGTIRQLTIKNPKNMLLGKVIVSTREVAAMTGRSLPRTRQLLRGLEHRGLVQKVDERSGWVLVEPSPEALTPCTG
jgi:hypothetical protein